MVITKMTFPRCYFSVKFSTYFPLMCKTLGESARRVLGKTIRYISTYPHFVKVSPTGVQKGVVIRKLSSMENSVDNVVQKRNKALYREHSLLFSTFPHSYLWTLDNIHFILKELRKRRGMIAETSRCFKVKRARQISTGTTFLKI